MKTTFTLLMLTFDPIMKETDAEVFCQCDRADRAGRIVQAMQKEYVSDWQIVMKQGRHTNHGPVLRSDRQNRCPKCLRTYTYNELQQAKSDDHMIGTDMHCECGCVWLPDWDFKGHETVLVWTETRPEAQEPAPEEQPADVKVPVPVYTFSNGFLKNGDAMFSRLRHANLTPTWGPWQDGNISICLPESEVPCLRMMQKANPARFGNAPKEEKEVSA